MSDARTSLRDLLSEGFPVSAHKWEAWADDILNQHAHELAEKIRAEMGCPRTEAGNQCYGSDCCQTAEEAAGLIAPGVET